MVPIFDETEAIFVCPHCKSNSDIRINKVGEKATVPLIEFCPCCGWSSNYGFDIEDETETAPPCEVCDTGEEDITPTPEACEEVCDAEPPASDEEPVCACDHSDSPDEPDEPTPTPEESEEEPEETGMEHSESREEEEAEKSDTPTLSEEEPAHPRPPKDATPEELDKARKDALDEMAVDVRLETLKGLGLLDDNQIEMARAMSKTDEIPVLEAVVKLGFVTLEETKGSNGVDVQDAVEELKATADEAPVEPEEVDEVDTEMQEEDEEPPVDPNRL